MYDLYYTVHILNILCGWASVSRFEIGLYVNGLNDFIQWWVCYSGVWMGKKNGNALSPNTEGVRRGTLKRRSRAEGARRFSAASGSRELCKLPHWVRSAFGAVLVWKCCIWQGPQGPKCLLTQIVNILCQVIFVSDWFISENQFLTFSITFGNRKKQISPLLAVIKSHSEREILRLMMPTRLHSPSPTNLVTLTIRVCPLQVPLTGSP